MQCHQFAQFAPICQLWTNYAQKFNHDQYGDIYEFLVEWHKRTSTIVKVLDLAETT